MLTALLLTFAIFAQDPQDQAANTNRSTSPAQDEIVGGTVSATEATGPVVCRREAVTGSNRTRRVCVRPEVAEHNRRESERFFNTFRDSLATPECATDPGTGCPARQKGE